MKGWLFFLTVNAFIRLVVGDDSSTAKTDPEAEATERPPPPIVVDSLEAMDNLVEEFGAGIFKTLSDSDIENQILQITYVASKIKEQKDEGVVSDEILNRMEDGLAKLIEELIVFLKVRSNAYAFFNAKGFERMISPFMNLEKTTDEVRNNIFLLVKTLHDVAPSTTNHVLTPAFGVNLINVFEDSSTSKVTRGNIVDILSFWLPRNPKVQAYILEHKGLEAFYDKINELEADGVFKILRLFATILKEHIDATSKDTENNDAKKFKEYKDMDFFLLLSTPKMCLGFIDVFQGIFANQMTDNEILLPVVDIVSLLKPYCGEIYKFNTKAVKFIDELRSFISEPNNGSFLKKKGVNMSELKRVLKEYSASYKAKKGEF